LAVRPLRRRATSHVSSPRVAAAGPAQGPGRRSDRFCRQRVAAHGAGRIQPRQVRARNVGVDLSFAGPQPRSLARRLGERLGNRATFPCGRGRPLVSARSERGRHPREGTQGRRRTRRRGSRRHALRTKSPQARTGCRRRKRFYTAEMVALVAVVPARVR